MFKNYLKVFIRSFRQAKLFTAINLVGLSVGMVAFIIIIHFIKFENSYDSFHLKSDRLFRLTIYDLNNDGVVVDKWATVSPGFGPEMKRYFPQVTDYTRLVSTRPFMSKPALVHKEKIFFEDNIYYADQQFLQMFSFPLITGNNSTALNEPNSIVISQAIASKYFGGDQALGKLMRLEMGVRGEVDLKVTGVMKEIPVNSHMKVDVLISFNTLPSRWNLDSVLDWGDFYVYLEFSNYTDANSVQKRLPEFLELLIGENANNSLLKIQKVDDIHLSSKLNHEIKPTGDGQMLRLLFIVAILILVIAWINYVNLTTAKLLELFKEFGLRKMMGATPLQLFTQQLTGTLIINIASFLIALTLAQLFLPVVYQLIDQPMVNDIFEDLPLLLTVFLIIIIGSIISGIYPAMILRKTSLNEIYKGALFEGKSGQLTKRLMLVFQFAMMVILMALTVTVYKQMEYIKSKEPGINLSQKLILKGPAKKGNDYQRKWESLSTALKRLNFIDNVAASTSIPGNELAWGRNIRAIELSNDAEKPVNIVAVDPVFFDLYDVKFVAGNNYAAHVNPSSNQAIFNEKAIYTLGYSSAAEAVGRLVTWKENDNDMIFEIIGVVKDFNQRSAKYNHEPIIFPLKSYLNAPWAGEYYSIKLNNKNTASYLALVEKEWQKVFGDNPFDFFFLDDFFDRQYKADVRFGIIFNGFTVLAIVISILGLFGLFSFTVNQRIKEIGIRKVLGASISSILKSLAKPYIVLLIISLVVAFPIAHLLAQAWLGDFSSKITLGHWFYAIPIISLLSIVLLTISIQMFKAATRNPVDSLRCQ